MKRIVLAAALTVWCTVLFADSIPDASRHIGQELIRFSQDISKFNSIYPQEKVYLQFDNTSYYSGETIWFKAFVVNASSLGQAQSKVLYVDLISPTGVLLKQQKLKIENGQADGSFSLLDGAVSQARIKRGMIGYPSGFYEVRAYTNYMLNFSEETVFSRVFAVYEKPQQEGGYYTENPTIKQHKRESWEIRPKTEKPGKINCSFYPEGGHIIIGKPCRIAFKVTDDTGFGVDATGILQGSDLTFSTVHDGMGWFTFTPQDYRNQVEITVDDHSHTFELPSPEQTGCALSVYPCGTDSIMLKLDCSAGLEFTSLGMTLTCRGELLDFCTLDISYPTQKTISMADAPEGVCRIHIFDSTGHIYASRSIYHHSSQFNAPLLEVVPDKQLYAPFEKVVLTFSLKDGQGNPFSDSFCLSVRDVRSLGNACADDLRTSLLLSSDLKGLIENPSWYFDTDNEERDQALDLLMLVQGWERYDWMTMAGQNAFNPSHSLEESLTMNGWILNSSGKKPLADIKVNTILAMRNQEKRISKNYSCVTDSSGYFKFNLIPEFYGQASFSIHAKAPKRIIGPDARIMFERSLTPAVRPYQQQELVLGNRPSRFIQSDYIKPEEVEEELPKVINADAGILLPDVDIEEKRKYIDYFTFTAYDVRRDAEIEMDKGEYTTDMMGYLMSKGYSFFNSRNDGVLINGFKPFFYIHDAGSFYYAGTNANPDTKYLKSILVYDRLVPLAEILKECTLMPQYMRDPMTSPFIEIKSYAPEFDRDLYERYLLIDILVKERKELGKKSDLYNINKRITTVEGYSIPYGFYSQEYPDGPILGEVDYRRTLYWNPSVTTNEEGFAHVEFYNNSITEHFSISAAGMTSTGVPYILDADY